MSYGIFESVRFMNEGQQADDYRARKAKEAEDKKRAEEERNQRREFNYGYRRRDKLGGMRVPSEEDFNRRDKAIDMVLKDSETRDKKAKDGLTKGDTRWLKNQYNAVAATATGESISAADRNIRRHPKKV